MHRKIAARWLHRQAGLFEPPPAMVKTITRWAVAQAAANKIAELQNGERHKKLETGLDAVRESIQRLKAALVTGKNIAPTYKAFWNATLVWGYYIPKTVSSREEAERAIQLAEEKLAHMSQHLEGDKTKLQQALREYTPYLLPGVHPMRGESVERDFEVDFDGWRYGDKDLIEQAVTKEIESRKELLASIESRGATSPEAKALIIMMRQGIEKEAASWAMLRTELSTRADGKPVAYWQPALRILTVRIPPDVPLEKMEPLLASWIAHELRHFAQTFLAHVKGVGDKVFSRLPGPGMPSKRIMTPQHAEGEHALRDVEFYTDLADAIERLRPKLDFLGREEKQKLFAHLTGMRKAEFRDPPEPFFMTLLKHAPPKWRKAVSEAYKAIF